MTRLKGAFIHLMRPHPMQPHSTRSRSIRPHHALLILVLVCSGFALLSGCSNRGELHPALRVDRDQLDWAMQRGKHLVVTKQDPEEAFNRGTQDVSIRVSPHVVIRQATCRWPADEIVYAIAQGGDASDAAIRSAIDNAMDNCERQIGFRIVVQVPDSYQSSDLTFALRTNIGQEYPPLAVEAPTRLRPVISALDPDLPASSLWAYEVRFPTQGCPGLPVIGKRVNGLDLIIRDADLEGVVNFRMQTPYIPGRR